MSDLDRVFEKAEKSIYKYPPPKEFVRQMSRRENNTTMARVDAVTALMSAAYRGEDRRTREYVNRISKNDAEFDAAAKEVEKHRVGVDGWEKMLKAVKALATKYGD